MIDLPANGTPWPPKPHDKVLAACAERQVWWEGDPDKLAAFYGSGTSQRADQVNTNRVRRAWRAFWSQPEPGTSNPKRLHVPVAADLGRVAAQSLFAEPIVVTDPGGNEALQAAIDDLCNTEAAHARLLESAESASMLGGTYGRIVWDSAIGEHPWIDWVDTDRAIPTFRWGHLTAVTFWTELDSGDATVVYRWLQHYTAGRIDHALYLGTGDNLGRVVPLTEHPATADLKVTLDGTGIETGTDRIAAQYFPNMRPNPEWRNEPALKDLGRADLTRDVIHLLDRIDACWSSWMNDLELGRGRIFISEELLQGRKNRTPGFDLDQSIYSPIGAGMGSTGEAMTYLDAQQFEIRVAEHQATFEQLLRRTLSRVGFSPITFGLSDEVAITATETDAKERDTNATRASRIRLRATMSDLLTTLMQVNAYLTNGPAPSEDLEVTWPSMRQQSDNQRATTVQMWEAAKAASTETKVRHLHPEWDKQRVEKEVAAIDDANSISVATLPEESDFGTPPPDAPDPKTVDEQGGNNDDPGSPQP